MNYSIGVLKTHSETLNAELKSVEDKYKNADIELQSDVVFFEEDISNLKKNIDDCVKAISILLNSNNN